MLSFLKKKNNPEDIYAPVCGRCISIENVPDKMFANRLMGDGAGFVFEGDTVFSPCDGEVMMIANTKHALGIKSKSGAEILIHIGLNTVECDGQGFTVLKKVGDKVKVHEPLLKVDRSFMKEHNIDLTSPMIITNMHEIDVELYENDDVDLHVPVLNVKRK